MKSTDILDTLMEALSYPTTHKDIIDNLDKLLSGKAYEKFMSIEITPDILPKIIVGATPLLETIYLLTDKILAELTPDLRARTLTYLDRCQEMYSASVSMLKDKVQHTTSSPKRPEEMTREELLDYIRTQFKD